MANEITITKGDYSLTVYATNVAEGFINKFFVLAPIVNAAGQTGGSSDARIVDLLRVTHNITIKGFIVGTTSKTAHDVKKDLKYIFDGGGIAGGTTSLVYDGDTYEGYIEKLTFTEVSFDEPSDFVTSKENYTDVVKYEVAITFLEGVSV